MGAVIDHIYMYALLSLFFGLIYLKIIPSNGCVIQIPGNDYSSANWPSLHNDNNAMETCNTVETCKSKTNK